MCILHMHYTVQVYVTVVDIQRSEPIDRLTTETYCVQYSPCLLSSCSQTTEAWSETRSHFKFFRSLKLRPNLQICPRILRK